MDSCFSFIKNALTALLLVILFAMCKKSISPSGDQPIAEEFLPKPVAVNTQVNKAFGGYYISLPEKYAESREAYPVLIFLHGAGQTGNGTTELDYVLNDGIGKLLKKQRFPAVFRSPEDRYSFVVVSPQYSKQPENSEVMEFVDHIESAYRVDKRRIYLAGLSLGARIVTLVAAKFPSKFAAIVPIAGVASGQGMEARCDSIATHNLPVWAFHNREDPMADPDATVNFIRLIDGFSPSVRPRLTLFDVYGHDAWTTALDPGYKENEMNIYEWMLRHSR